MRDRREPDINPLAEMLSWSPECATVAATGPTVTGHATTIDVQNASENAPRVERTDAWHAASHVREFRSDRQARTRTKRGV